MDTKKLIALAKACRKAGITQYKCAEFEFTLSDAPESKRTRRSSKAKETPVNDPKDLIADEETLSSEELLYWSTGELPPEGTQ